jgi:hypothetical protein
MFQFKNVPNKFNEWNTMPSNLYCTRSSSALHPSDLHRSALHRSARRCSAHRRSAHHRSGLLHKMAPYCNICSYRQPTRPLYDVYHRHFSSREVRIMQGVEYSTTNTTYLCPTCMSVHNIWPDYGLNVCLGTSQLHNIHHPRDPTVICPPDPIHVDWVTG